MPRLIPPLVHYLEQDVDRAMSLARAGEIIRSIGGAGSVTSKELTVVRLEALYEMSLLRIFIAWEEFLEEAFLRYLCGYSNSNGPEHLNMVPFKKIIDAKHDMLEGSDFVSWQVTTRMLTRARKYINSGCHERVIGSSSARLTWYAAIRNRIAHKSDYSRRSFDTATMGLAGRRYRGANPGRFLRDWDTASVPSERWLFAIARELKQLSAQVVP